MVYIAKNTEETSEEITEETPVAIEPRVGDAVATSSDFLSQIPPKTAMIVGMVGAVMTLCSIGFIILLYFVFAK